MKIIITTPAAARPHTITAAGGEDPPFSGGAGNASPVPGSEAGENK
ncbi:hypothetical protein WMO79_19545 [Micrococcaceae bacterium Sec7.4]